MAPNNRKSDRTSTPSSKDQINTLLNENVEQVFTSLLSFMKDKGMSFEDLQKKYYTDQHHIPLAIFTTKLSPSEAICKYLKENGNLTFHQIARALDRDDRSIWTSYKRASKKQPSKLSIDSQTPSIPVTILKNRQLSFLENITYHLYTQGMKPKQIALVLNRKAPIIHTVLNRAKKKLQQT